FRAMLKAVFRFYEVKLSYILTSVTNKITPLEAMSKWIRIFFTTILIITIHCLHAQDYRAINGSSYTGSLSAANNPASIVHVPSAWEITPMAIQFKESTNSLIIDSLSFVSNWKNVNVKLKNGTFKHFLMVNQDLRLFNTRIRLNSNSAIAFGISGRSYLSAKTSRLNGQDTIGSLREFMGINLNNTPVSGQTRGQMWAEFYGTYARTIFKYPNAVLNAGITVKVNSGLAGGFMTASGFEDIPGTVNNKPGYYLTNGNLDYGYSSNMDVLDTSTTYQNARKDFFRKTFSTIGISLGAEYIIPQGEGDDNGYGYTLKIGASLLDLGNNNFQYSEFSRSAVLNKSNVSDSLIETSTDNTNSPSAFADTLQSIAGSTSTPTGNFKIFQPARLVINVDKQIARNFFINADLTVPLTVFLGKKKLYVRDMNFFSLTPRFETKGFGIYLPTSLNTKMHFWIGGALRAGPLLFGVHNLANILSKNKLQDGGAYLAFTFRFKNKSEKDSDTDNLDKPRFSAKQLRQLKCPKPIY
ncbi:MAG: hypothetical protein JJE22_10585, partial [Bacteroidia bacterium]|nr:hypothetical protein [Bacteroidia bacterium]